MIHKLVSYIMAIVYIICGLFAAYIAAITCGEIQSPYAEMGAILSILIILIYTRYRWVKIYKR